MMSKEEFGEWKSDPRTQEVFQRIREYREAYHGPLLAGETLRTNHSQEITAEFIGVLKGLDYILEIEWGEEEDGQSQFMPDG